MLTTAAPREPSRSDRAEPGRIAAPAAATATTRRRLIVIFLVAFALPLEPVVGGLLLSAPRLYIMVAFLPFAIALLAGRCGGVTATDMMIFGCGFWVVLTFVIHHGAERIPYAAITAVEMIGAYLAGRFLIRSSDDYRFFFNAFFVMLAVLLPLAAFETMTGRALLSEVLSKVARVTPRGTEIRDGYFRAGMSYPHPILWGMICAVFLAQAWYLWPGRTVGRISRVTVAVASTLTAMSSAPILSLAIQGGLILWGRLTGNRWWLFTILFTISYVTIDLLSNRGPVIIMIETLTLNPQTAWWRVHIWNYGTASVMNHPFLGIGLNEWQRPEWLAPTVDNFWLLIAMRHGLPAALFITVGLALQIWRLARLQNLAPADQAVRTAYMIAFVALCFMLGTVHAWGAPLIFVMFYFGMGGFLYTGGAGTAHTAEAGVAAADHGAPQPLPHSRFPIRPRDGAKGAAEESRARAKPAPANPRRPAQGSRTR